MQIVRVDVDTQVGFCLPEGKLYVPAADHVLANIRALVADAVSRGYPLIGCVDSHAYDAWEFAENGGPFPAHCVKGTSDWLKIPGTLPPRFRFIPMSDGSLVIGEDEPGGGIRSYTAAQFSNEARDGVGLYFEKEVYSAFSNPNSRSMLRALVDDLGGAENVVFQVFGYCTGDYCVDAFARGLADCGYQVEVVLEATAAIDTPDNGNDGLAFSRQALIAAGMRVVSTREALGR